MVRIVVGDSHAVTDAAVVCNAVAIVVEAVSTFLALS
jgi:hypothetical protein